MRVKFLATMLLVAYVAIDGGLGLPAFHDGNGIKLQQVSTKNDDSLLSPFPQWIPLSVLMNKLPRNNKTLFTHSDRLVPTHTRTKRSERESFSDYLEKAMKKPAVLHGINYDLYPVKDDLPREPVLGPRIKRSPQESWHHWWYGTVWPVIKGKNTMG
ncbi:unnamed protein product [Orchesella dallaii]|uniref:Uncharacterized protein n=1 Tax=Orchesella dallaii TaxID=48710 RepID=A0ABP1R084_9HEXA